MGSPAVTMSLRWSIPLGESRTYAEVARTVRSAARAVGQACGRNPIALIVPCHRVVGSRGASYVVRGESCTCPDHANRKVRCKHYFATLAHLNAQKAVA